MKKAIKLALFFCLLSSCTPSPIKPQATNLPQTQSAEVTSTPADTITPSPTITFTTTPVASQIAMENVQIVYYDVQGSTAEGLRASMNESRPRDPHDDNHPVDSYTDWYVSWNWPGYGTATCDLSAAVLTYHINIIMPRWDPPDNASPELIAKWKIYLQNLLIHEKGHVDNVVNNYLNIQTAIQSGTCLTAEMEAQKALETLRKFDADYDSATKHGEAQGAVFP